MKIISLEYCHISPDTHWETEIHHANVHAPAVLKMYEGMLGGQDAEIQKCIMIDDLHSKQPVTPEFIQKLIDQLEVKPDCVYLESSFVVAASEIAAMIDPHVALKDQCYAGDESTERTWLKNVHDKFDSTNDFLMSWKAADGSVVFSCPTVVAASYLARLGLVDVEVKPIYGSSIKKADMLVNVISSVYMSVEANTQLIIKATYPEALNNIRWDFY